MTKGTMTDGFWADMLLDMSSYPLLVCSMICVHANAAKGGWMDFIDFLIGLTMMNAMPHFVLGIWQGRMFSAFGFGNWQNILYGLLNFVISLALFLFKYGANQLFQNHIYFGALTLLVIYLLTGQFWYKLFQQK